MTTKTRKPPRAIRKPRNYYTANYGVSFECLHGQYIWVGDSEGRHVTVFDPMEARKFASWITKAAEYLEDQEKHK